MITFLQHKAESIGGRVKFDPASILTLLMGLLPVILSMLELFFGKTTVQGRDVERYYRAKDKFFLFRGRARAERLQQLKDMVSRRLIGATGEVHVGIASDLADTQAVEWDQMIQATKGNM